MKREIVCIECSKRECFKGGYSDRQYSAIEAAQMAQEGMRKVCGKLLNSCCCDFCNVDLAGQSEAVCITFYNTERETPQDWESSYVYSDWAEVEEELSDE